MQMKKNPAVSRYFLENGEGMYGPNTQRGLGNKALYPFSFPKMATALSTGGPPKVWESPRRGFLI